ncbi:MAG: hypothetical protein M3P30_11835 [Chloroflexota bacterium]|nr:hypothetical protein [Chloroflexota bacterium]
MASKTALIAIADHPTAIIDDLLSDDEPDAIDSKMAPAMKRTTPTMTSGSLFQNQAVAHASKARMTNGVISAAMQPIPLSSV